MSTVENKKEEKQYQIEILVRSVKTKDGKKSFNAYKVVEKSGALVDLSFTREVKDLPASNGYITVKASQINKQNNLRFPKYWVKGYVKFEPKQLVIDTTSLDEAFGNDDTDPDTLQF